MATDFAQNTHQKSMHRVGEALALHAAAARAAAWRCSARMAPSSRAVGPAGAPACAVPAAARRWSSAEAATPPPVSPEALERVKAMSEELTRNVMAGAEAMRREFGERDAEKVRGLHHRVSGPISRLPLRPPALPHPHPATHTTHTRATTTTTPPPPRHHRRRCG